MTDQKPNCSTCLHYQGHRCAALPERMTSDEMYWIERVGCLSHPDARAYLMRDVIGELEKQKAWCHEKSLADTSGNSKAFMWTAGGYEKAISLIRDVVKK